MSIHSLNVTYHPNLSQLISQRYHQQYKVKGQSSRDSQTLLDLFTHSQRIYFGHRYYLKRDHYPTFEEWYEFNQQFWSLHLKTANVYQIVHCNPAQHRWGYLIQISTDLSQVSHDLLKQTQQVAQTMINHYSIKAIRTYQIIDVFIHHQQLNIILTNPK